MSEHSEARNEFVCNVLSYSSLAYKILWIPVSGQLNCNNRAVSTTEMK